MTLDEEVLIRTNFERILKAAIFPDWSITYSVGSEATL